MQQQVMRRQERCAGFGVELLGRVSCRNETGKMALVTISGCHTVGRTHTEIGESESDSGVSHFYHWLPLELEQRGQEHACD